MAADHHLARRTNLIADRPNPSRTAISEGAASRAHLAREPGAAHDHWRPSGSGRAFEAGHRREQHFGIGMEWWAEHVLDPALLADFTAEQHEDPVR